MHSSGYQSNPYSQPNPMIHQQDHSQYFAQHSHPAFSAYSGENYQPYPPSAPQQWPTSNPTHNEQYFPAQQFGQPAGYPGVEPSSLSASEQKQRLRRLKRAIIHRQFKVTPQERNMTKAHRVNCTLLNVLFISTLVITSYEQYKLRKWVFPRSAMLLTLDVLGFYVTHLKQKQFDRYVQSLDDKYTSMGMRFK